MKLLYIFLFACRSRGALLILLLFCSIHARAMNGLLERKITITLEDMPVEDALHRIAALADIRFVYSESHLRAVTPVSIHAVDKPLGKLLDELLLPLGIGYKVFEAEASIALQRLPRTGSTASLINGQVLDVTGKPMPGVSVFVKGTSRGAVTDAEGRFTLEAEATDILVFSFIGYATLERTAGNDAALTVTLTEEASTLGEVVVNAGYWLVNKQEQTGNISRVTAKDLEKQPVSNPLLGLNGRMPGVVVQQVSGVPGSGVRIQIRGQNSLRSSVNDNGNLPLYVIDGVPVESAPVQSAGALFAVGGIDPLNTLNPANIESIEILKDADATSVYGSRGANGVVLITTKKGTTGVLRVDLQAYLSAGRATGQLDLMNTKQYLAMRREAFELDGVSPGAGDFDLNGTWDTTRYTNWQDRLYGGTALFRDVQLSVSGGSELLTCRAGIGVHHETTVFPGSFGYRKITGNLNVRQRSRDKKFSLSVSINYGFDNNDLFNRNLVQDALTLSPNAPVYKEDGSLEWAGYTTDRMNPLSYLKLSHKTETNMLITQASVSYELYKGLKLLSSFGFTDSDTEQVIHTPQASMNPDNLQESKSNLARTNGNTWIIEPQVSYTGNVPGGKLDVLAGASWQETTTDDFAMEGSGFVSDALLGNMRAARTQQVLRDAKTVYRYNAFFGRIGYNWKSRYLVNLTMRRDGSSRFGNDNKFGTFWATGIGWIFSEEAFIQGLSNVLSFGKVRASYGTTGSDRIGNYGYFATYTPATTLYQNGTVLNTTALANPDFGWEVNRKLEAAIDLGFFRDRLNLSFSAYRNRSSSQLVGYPLPATTGFTSIQYNLEATVQNSGVELELSGNVISNTNVRWRSAFNITVPRNKLVSYPGLATSSYADSYVVGEPLTISKRYTSTGIDSLTGVYTVWDADENGSYNAADRRAIVNIGREYFGGFSNTVSYKNIELDFMLEFVKQTSSGYYNLFVNQPGTMNNQPAFILDERRWQEAGDPATLQRFSQGSRTPYSRMLSSDRNMSDASFLRLRTVSLSWKFPMSVLGRIKLTEASVYVQVQNLFTLSRHEGINPEIVSAQLPPLRTFTTGLILKL